jgi:predicted double-glycine peptidase
MRSRVLVLALLSLLNAAAYGESLVPVDGRVMRVPIQGLKQTRIATTVLQKYDFSCGSAAVATLLAHHYGHVVDEEEVLRTMYAHGDQTKIQKEGFSLLDMKNYLARLGYTADGFEQPLEKLAAAKLPAIVLINENGYHHFVVVKGVDRGMVLVGDPARGTRVFARADFERIWVSKLLFVIHSHVEKARFNLVADWRAAPPAPIGSGVSRNGAIGVDLPKQGPGDF